MYISSKFVSILAFIMKIGYMQCRLTDYELSEHNYKGLNCTYLSKVNKSDLNYNGSVNAQAFMAVFAR